MSDVNVFMLFVYVILFILLMFKQSICYRLILLYVIQKFLCKIIIQLLKYQIYNYNFSHFINLNYKNQQLIAFYIKNIIICVFII